MSSWVAFVIIILGELRLMDPSDFTVTLPVP
jgi:hypothetical protein